jgi:hypothetical protein
MKKIVGILAIVLVAVVIVYSIRSNGFDIVIASGALMIVFALVIAVRILSAHTQKQNQLN